MADATTEPSALEIRFSARGQLRPLAGLVLFLLADVMLWHDGSVPWQLAVAGIVVFGAVVVGGAVMALRSRTWGWVVRLDARGVTVQDGPLVPWSDLSEVVVTGLQPAWLYWIGGRRCPVVAFIPRAGVQLPALRLPRRPGAADRLGAARERLYRTRLVLMPQMTSATVEEVTAAARHWGNLPVSTRLPPRQP